MDNRKLLNMGLVAGAVAIVAALVGYLFFWPSDNTTAYRYGKPDSGRSECRMMDEGGCMKDKNGGMNHGGMDCMDDMDGMMQDGMMESGMCRMMSEMMGGMGGAGGMMGMMGGPTGSNATPITIDQAADAAKEYVEKFDNPDLRVKNIIEYANFYYSRVEEKGKNTGAFELLINRHTGVVMSEPGPNMMWNTKYGSDSSDDSEDDNSMGGMHEGMNGDDSMGGMHGGMSDSSGMMNDGICGMMQGGMMDDTSGMMQGGMMNNSNARENANATTDMPVKKAEARDRAQKYLDKQMPGAKAGEPVTYYGYYTIRIDKDGRNLGMLSVNGYEDQLWYHSWLGAHLSGKQL